MNSGSNTHNSDSVPPPLPRRVPPPLPMVPLAPIPIVERTPPPHGLPPRPAHPLPSAPPLAPNTVEPSQTSELYESNTELDSVAQSSQAIRVGWWTRLHRGVASFFDWVFGAMALIFGLALLSALPVFNFLVLGYLLEASARVARSGRLRSGFIGVRKASVLGRIVLGSWLVLMPARFISDLWQSAQLIDPSGSAPGLRVALIALVVVTVVHIVWAVVRGGKLRHFLWPAPLRFVLVMFRPKSFESARDAVWNYVASLRLHHFFLLGARGFLAAAAWLVVPVGVLILASQLPQGPSAVVSFFGGCLLAAVVLYLPFLEVRFALENRMRAMFELRAVRQWFRHAPIAFWFALLITFAFAIPLYALKVELTPQEVAWLPGLLFVVLGFPARLMAGWAVGRARKRQTPRHWLFRWTSRFAGLPLALAYALLLYLSQYLSWHGVYSLFEQHAFLVPAPLLEWIWGIF